MSGSLTVCRRISPAVTGTTISCVTLESSCVTWKLGPDLSAGASLVYGTEMVLSLYVTDHQHDSPPIRFETAVRFFENYDAPRGNVIFTHPSIGAPRWFLYRDEGHDGPHKF